MAIKVNYAPLQDGRFKLIFMKYYRFIRCFFKFFGSQNDYLYPFEGQVNGDSMPFKIPHWYKTRFGFNTAWSIAKCIHL